MVSVSQEFLGNGLVSPLHRAGGNDYVTSSGVELVRSTIRQIIGTNRGELRWRPNFGVSLFKHKHKINNDALEIKITDEIQSSILQFEPRVRVISTAVNRSGNLFIAKVTWTLIDKNTPDNQVLLGPDTFEVIL